MDELNNGKTKNLSKVILESEEYKSGRIGEKHLDAYKELIKKGVRFTAIRENKIDWNDTDFIMSTNLRTLLSKEMLVIAVLGNLHVLKNSFRSHWNKSGDYICHPVGELLKEEATSILIKYKNCKYRNFGKTSKINQDDKGVLAKNNPVIVPGNEKQSSCDYHLWVADANSI